MEKYNKDKLVKVKVNEASQAELTLKTEKKLFGRVVRQAGIYCNYTGEYHGVQPPDHCFIYNGKVFRKPSVDLFYQAGHNNRHYFDTHYQAVKFVNEITYDGRWRE